MPNRLADAMSPYLAQHRDNPVDWYEWGEEAFALARQRDVPVLLSIGYAACHWCHVMAHESFEDPVVAVRMNRSFVNVKVDREERPDVDAIYMAVTQAMTGRGGWPMTVFLTHDGRPFHTGTYYPPRPIPPTPSFGQLLSAVDRAWRERRDEIEDLAGNLSGILTPADGVPDTGTGPPDPSLLTEAVRQLARGEDRDHGGFGSAPKFPPSLVCAFLLRHAAGQRLRTATGSSPIPSWPDGDTGRTALDLAGRALRAMAQSGMYDQVAGGFARYAVDRAWTVPHFEKMLSDNALLARVYLDWWRLTGEPTGARIAAETCTWMVTALSTPDGGLGSSLDADTPMPALDGSVHGVEGATYVWTVDQLHRVLGPEEGTWVAGLLGVTPEGTFEHGTSTLRLTRDVWADPAQRPRWVAARDLMARSRSHRAQPARDDKVVACWNGLAIAALAETGAVLDRPDLVRAAEQIADLLVSVHLVVDPPAGHGSPTGPRVRLRRVSRDGRPGRAGGVLEDYGDVAEGLLALHAVTGEPAWLEIAGGLLDAVLVEFFTPVDPEDPQRFSVHDTPSTTHDPSLAALGRPHEITDGAAPSGTAAAAGALLSYAAATGSARHRNAAVGALRLVTELVPRAPQGFGWAMAVAEALADGPREIAVAGRADDPDRDLLHRVALAGTAPGRVVAVGEPDTPGIPLLTGRTGPDGRATAHVCRGFVCELPTSRPEALASSTGTRPDVLPDGVV